MGPRTWYGALDRVQKGALGYSIVMLMVIGLLAVSGAGAGTAGDRDAAPPIPGTANLPAPPAAPVFGTPLSPPLPADSPVPQTTVATLPLPSSVAVALPAPTPVASLPTAPAPSVALVQTVDAFEQGTAEGVTLGPDGALALSPAVSDDFTDAALDTATWQFVRWSPGGTVRVHDGAVTVNVAAIRTARTFVHASFEARVRFTAGPPPFENIAWSADLNGPTAIMIGEPVDDPSHIYARIKQEGQDDQRVQLPVSFDADHVYRIAWGAARVDFYVDDVLRATIPATLDTPMRAWISAAMPGHAPTVDWARVLAYDTPAGAFTSTSLDAGDTVTWNAVRMDAMIPPGTAATIRSRTSADGRIWSAYEPLAADGGVISPPGRYLQYEIILSGTETASPVIRSVTVTRARRIAARRIVSRAAAPVRCG